MRVDPLQTGGLPAVRVESGKTERACEPPMAAMFPLPDGLAFDERMRAMTAGRGGAGGLRPHQAFVAAYLAPETPYRGLLLFHGLGTGKTRAAIAAAEPHARSGTPVIALLPASLRRTFANEMRAAGATFPVEMVSYNGVSAAWIDRWTEGGSVNPMDGAFIIVDEVHNLTRALSGERDVGPPSSRQSLYDLVVQARNSRVVLLTGSPAVNRAHEIALAVNMARGEACEHTLRWRRKLVLREVRDIEAALRQCDSVVAASVTPTGATLRMAPLGFRVVHRGADGPQVARASGATHAVPECVAKLVPKGSKLRPMCRPPFPDSLEAFESYFIDAAGKLAAPTVLARRCRGAVSVCEAAVGPSFPTVVSETVLSPLSASQFGEYCRVRVLERRSEGRRGAATVHRQYSRSVSNFTFPSADGIRKTYRSEASDDATHEAARAAALTALLAHPMWADDALLSRYSPKFVAALSAMDVSPGPVMVYSAFRQLEGAGLFARALDGRGWRRVTLSKNGTDRWEVVTAQGKPGAPRYIVPEPNTEDGAYLVAMFNGDTAALPTELSDAPRIRAVILTRSGAEGLSLKGVRQVHILEPHWNAALSRQVAARAVRLGSHDALPQEDRNVHVFTHVATFSEAQKASSRFEAIAQRDGGITTDQHLLKVSAAKDARIDAVLDAVRGAAVDCGAWGPVGPVGCYVPAAGEFGVGKRPMMPVLLEADAEDGRRVVRDRVVRVGGRLLVIPGDGGTFAYDAAGWEKGDRVVVGEVRPEDGAVRLLKDQKAV